VVRLALAKSDLSDALAGFMDLFKNPYSPRTLTPLAADGQSAETRTGTD
jgi:hypothetical protein